MDRTHFQLDSGYLNVDDAGLYFTRSGNWDEAEKTSERRSSVQPALLVRRLFGAMLLLASVVFYFAKGSRIGDGSSGATWPIALAVVAFGFLRLRKRLQADFGHSFRIPFSKIHHMSHEGRTMTIAFINGKWKEDDMKAGIDLNSFKQIEERFQRSRRK